MDAPERPPPDLEGFVLDKLAQVIGFADAPATLLEAKRVANVDVIARPEDVMAVGKAMAGQGAFVGIVGDLLVLTAGRWRSA